VSEIENIWADFLTILAAGHCKGQICREDEGGQDGNMIDVKEESGSGRWRIEGKNVSNVSVEYPMV